MSVVGDNSCLLTEKIVSVKSLVKLACEAQARGQFSTSARHMSSTLQRSEYKQKPKTYVIHLVRICTLKALSALFTLFSAETDPVWSSQMNM